MLKLSEKSIDKENVCSINVKNQRLSNCGAHGLPNKDRKNKIKMNRASHTITENFKVIKQHKSISSWEN